MPTNNKLTMNKMFNLDLCYFNNSNKMLLVSDHQSSSNDHCIEQVEPVDMATQSSSSSSNSLSSDLNQTTEINDTKCINQWIISNKQFHSYWTVFWLWEIWKWMMIDQHQSNRSNSNLNNNWDFINSNFANYLKQLVLFSNSDYLKNISQNYHLPSKQQIPEQIYLKNLKSKINNK